MAKNKSILWERDKDTYGGQIKTSPMAHKEIKSHCWVLVWVFEYYISSEAKVVTGFILEWKNLCVDGIFWSKTNKWRRTVIKI